MRRAVWLVATAIVCVACEGAGGVEVAARDAASEAGASDRDADGLCDDSELAMGSDPERADTDGDGLLDGHELIAGTDARDREDPGADHIVFLQLGSSVEVAVALSLESGSGSDAVGAFGDRNAFDIEERRAADFFRGSVAVAAVPAENARVIDARAARFKAVVGRTQLQFRLSFAAKADARASSSNAADACAAVLPFDYGATSDDGTELGGTKQRFVLIVSDDSPPLKAAQYCLPATCL